VRTLGRTFARGGAIHSCIETLQCARKMLLSKVTLLVGDVGIWSMGPRLKQGSLDQHESASQTASRSLGRMLPPGESR